MSKKWDFELHRKQIFMCLIMISFLLIFVFNWFTPMMTDDYSYKKIVMGANSFADLVRQEQFQYMTWTGRSVNHMILRIFLSLPVVIFKIMNSVAFVALSIFMYLNINKKKTHDILCYLLIQLFLWFFAVSFAQTILWETGACNYLWGSTIIMGYITVLRALIDKTMKLNCNLTNRNKIIYALLTLVLGLLAGWCNENTSGGCLLLSIIFTYLFVRETKQVKGFMVTGILGNCLGLAIMVLAPGNANRAQFSEEEHEGLYALFSRWQKCNLAIRNQFFILLAIGITAFILVRLQQKLWRDSRNMLIFAFVFIATCYALCLIAEPNVRAYFGAGIFLTIAVVQGILDVDDSQLWIRTIKLAGVSIMCLSFFFTYLESGANLVRINREEKNRNAYVESQIEAGITDVVVPMLHPDFESKYSDAYNSDLSDDPEYWINVGYAQYYNLDSVTAIPWDEWNE